MAKMKMDVSWVKDFLIAKGERVGLIVAGVITGLLLAVGVWAGMSSTPQHEEIEKQAKAIQARIASADPGPDVFPPDGGAKPPTWDPLGQPDRFFAGTWYDPGAVGDNKLRNPIALPIDTLAQGKKQIQVDVVRAAIATYSLNAERKKIFGLGPEGTKPAQALENLAVQIRPHRLVVVHATFPYRDQLEIYRKALRKDSIADVLQNPEITPKFLGLNVKRCEVLPDGKQTPWVDVYTTRADGKITVSAAVEEVLVYGFYDLQSDTPWHDTLEIGMATPLPTLAFGNYPTPDLPEVIRKSEDGEDPPVKPPMGVGRPAGDPKKGLPGVGLPGTGKPPEAGEADPGLKEIPVDFKTLNKVDPQLVARFQGKIHPFHPRGEEAGLPPDAAQPGVPGERPKVVPPPVVRPPEGGKLPPPMVGGKAGDPPTDQPEKKMIRFFDAGVQAGKTYVYSVQVMLKNPNFGKRDEVQYTRLAEQNELVSGWAYTPAVTVGSEFDYYVVDQKVLDRDKFKSRLTRGIDDKDVSVPLFDLKKDIIPPTPDKVAVQLHTWVETFQDAQNRSAPGGDWGIAERLLLSRGESIGRNEVEVLFPEWNVTRSGFQVGAPPATEKDPKSKLKPKTGKTGAKLNFQPRQGAPLVVDFQGGRTRTIGAGEDDSVIEVLVLTADGRLEMRTSYEDSNRATPRGRERQERHQRWVQRVSEPPAPVGTTPMPMPTPKGGG